MHPDLFPETLLVDLLDGHPMTDSLRIAEHFKKHHRDVLKAIRSLLDRTSDPERLRNFAQSFTTFTSANGAQRKRPIYLLTRDGFFFVASGFTGAEADEWKWKFLDAFNALEAELHAKSERYAHALDQVRPMLRPVVEATEAGQSRAEIATPLGKSPAAITYHRAQARRFGLLAA